MLNIAIIGASTHWTPALATDLMLTFSEPIEFRLVDIDPGVLELGAAWGEMATARHGRRDSFRTFRNRRDALREADAVLITLSTGGLDASERDIAICERYRIYPTVGDSIGPTGWSRALGTSRSSWASPTTAPSCARGRCSPTCPTLLPR